MTPVQNWDHIKNSFKLKGQLGQHQGSTTQKLSLNSTCSNPLRALKWVGLFVHNQRWSQLENKYNSPKHFRAPARGLRLWTHVRIAMSFITEGAADPGRGLLDGVDAGLVLPKNLLGRQVDLAELAGVPSISNFLWRYQFVVCEPSYCKTFVSFSIHLGVLGSIWWFWSCKRAWDALLSFKHGHTKILEQGLAFCKRTQGLEDNNWIVYSLGSLPHLNDLLQALELSIVFSVHQYHTYTPRVALASIFTNDPYGAC